MLLVTLFLLLSACTPVVDTPTPAPITVDTSTSTPSPSLTPENTPTPTSTPVPWTSDTDIVFYEQDIIKRCALLGDYKADHLTIENYSLLTNCGTESSDTRYCKISMVDGNFTETHFNTFENPTSTLGIFSSPNGEWVATVQFTDSYQLIKLISSDGVVLDPKGTQVDKELYLVDWLDEQTLLFDSGSYSFVDEEMREMYAFNPFTNVMEKKMVSLEGISPAEKFPIIKVNPSFDQVFYHPVLGLSQEDEELNNSVIRNIDTGEVLWRGFEYMNYTFPDWSIDGSLFALQNTRYSNSETVNPQTIVILDSKGDLVKTLWFEFLDGFSLNQIKWAPDKKILAIWVHVDGEPFYDFKLYLFDFEKSKIIDTCYTGSGMQWINWRPDSKGFIINPGYNQISNSGPTYFDLQNFYVYSLNNWSDSPLQWIKRSDN